MEEANQIFNRYIQHSIPIASPFVIPTTYIRTPDLSVSISSESEEGSFEMEEVKVLVGWHIEGDLSNGLIEGFAKLSNPEGSTYEGNWVKEKRHGWGKQTYPEGEFEGEWIEGRIQGKGKFTTYGTTFEGTWYWKNGKLCGNGLINYPNNTLYKGQWCEGKPEGIGKKIYEDGAIYKGQWINGKRNGKGKQIFADKTIYKGQWVEDKRDGQGLYTTNNWTYKGNWSENTPNGKGKQTNSEGLIYDGNWKDGLKHGKGKLIYPNKEIVLGKWHNNELIELRLM